MDSLKTLTNTFKDEGSTRTIAIKLVGEPVNGNYLDLMSLTPNKLIFMSPIGRIMKLMLKFKLNKIQN